MSNTSAQRLELAAGDDIGANIFPQALYARSRSLFEDTQRDIVKFL